MGDDIYAEGLDAPKKTTISRRSELKDVYVRFFNDFREYLVEFMQDARGLVDIKEVKVGVEPVTIDLEEGIGRPVVVKNQGQIECYLTTGQGGYRLDAGQEQRVWQNRPLQILTVSGTTTVGIIST